MRRRENLNSQRGVYSGLDLKSNDVGRLWGFLKVPVSFLMSIHAHSAHWNKMATCDFGPVTVISCETALFFIYIWIISWDAT